MAKLETNMKVTIYIVHLFTFGKYTSAGEVSRFDLFYCIPVYMRIGSLRQLFGVVF